MKLHWFSPIPPENSGIASYTAQILPAFATQADITVWTTLSDYDPGLTEYAEVRRYRPESPPWRELNEGDACIYHIGNNWQFHGPILRLSRRLPGIVVLHDLQLHDLVLGMARADREFPKAYVALMADSDGRVGRLDAELFSQGKLDREYMSARYPCTTFVLANALACITHNPAARLNLATRHHLPVIAAPLSYKPRGEDASRYGAPGRKPPPPPYRLIVFGHIGYNRRIMSLIEALARMPERHTFRLDIYGNFDSAHFRDTVEAAIERHGLGEIVALRGFVSDTILTHALDDAHLAINLRFPSMGEASFSQLEIWDHALPTVVTRVGWYETLPDDAVNFVSPGNEIADLQCALRGLLTDPERLARMGQAGRRHLLDNHMPEHFVRALTETVAQAPELRLRSIASHLARRVGEQIGRGPGTLVTAATYERMARHIAEMTGLPEATPRSRQR